LPPFFFFFSFISRRGLRACSLAHGTLDLILLFGILLRRHCTPL
jgi:hypothetical protein